jgi:hypothetical protein
LFILIGHARTLCLRLLAGKQKNVRRACAHARVFDVRMPGSSGALGVALPCFGRGDGSANLVVNPWSVSGCPA